MKPFQVDGRTIPQAPGRCHLCGTPLGDPRDASTQFLGDRFRMVCREAAECLVRRRERLTRP